MNALVLCVGKLKEDWQRAGCAEYVKRLSRYGTVTVEETPDERETGTEALDRRATEKEGRALLSRIKKDDRVVALCIQGVAPDSVRLAREIERWSLDGRRLVFVIGGSRGLSDEFLARADARLSFSNLTFPHPLMRVILLEQLYRCAKITAGETYHK